MSNLPFNIPKAITTDSTTLPCCLTGCTAFSTTLALSTFTQLKLLTVSTGSKPPIPTVIGLVSVGLASLASHSAAVKTHALVKSIGGDNTLERHNLPRNTKDDVVIGNVRVASNALRICCVGLITFKLLGGRFWAISPSSYTHLGSFARWSLPATDAYASTSQRSSIERLGRLVGCHTCGSRELLSSFSSLKQKVKFHADHMPPRAVTKQMNARWWRRFSGWTVTQRFYPQCVTCSNNQGGILARATGQLEKRSKGMIMGRVPNLAKAGGGRRAYFHGFRFRSSHLTGGVIAGLTVHNSKDWDIMNGNERRFKELEFTAKRYLKSMRATLVSLSKR